MRTLFAATVWGEPYLSRFLDYSLPTLLSKGNLGEDPGDLDGSEFLFVTRAADEGRIRAHPSFIQLAKRIDVRFDFLVDSGGDKYAGVSDCQTRAIGHSLDFEALCFLYADIIWSEGTLGNAMRRMQHDDLDAVLVPAPAVTTEPFLASLLERVSFDARAPDGVAVPPRDLVAAALENLHPLMQAYRWDLAGFSTFPAYLTWPTGPHALLLHPFHLHPVLLRVQHANPAFFQPVIVSLDEEYAPRVIESLSRVYCARDSDEISMCTLMDPDMSLPQILPDELRASEALIACWAERHTGTAHRQFFRHGFRFHATEVDETRWREVEAGSRVVVESILDRLRTPDSTLRYEEPEAYAARRIRAIRNRRVQRRLARRPPVTFARRQTRELVRRIPWATKAWLASCFPHLWPRVANWVKPYLTRKGLWHGDAIRPSRANIEDRLGWIVVELGQRALHRVRRAAKGRS